MIGKISIDDMRDEVVDWIKHYLPDDQRDSFNTAIKMQEELSELMHVLHTGDGNIGQELADILVLLVDVAYLNNVDLTTEFKIKMKINRARKWNKIMGTLKHEA